MDFKQFLAAKQALALVEHMETLSEQDAQQLFDTLDEETVEFIEAVLSEISAGTYKKQRGEFVDYLTSPASNEKPDPTKSAKFLAAFRAYEQRGGKDPVLARKDRRAAQRRASNSRSQQGRPETRQGPSAVSLGQHRRNMSDSQEARQASKYPQNG